MIEQRGEIVKVTSNDLEELRTISITTFSETFSHLNTQENMQKYFSENLSHEKLANEISDVNSVFYFCKFDHHVIGYLKLNTGTSQTETESKNSIEMERIYVLKEYHGKQFGKLLLQKGIDYAHEKKCNYVWLGVWELNVKAIAFYRKHGFEVYDKHVFKLGDDEQTDLLMKLIL